MAGPIFSTAHFCRGLVVAYSGVAVAQNAVPNDDTWDAAEIAAREAGGDRDVRRTHYRPRLADGESVDSDGVKVRQGVWFSP